MSQRSLTCPAVQQVGASSEVYASDPRKSQAP